jgi:Arc/MetJ-type ribon-helix-helix transcriptional regulator
MKRVQLQLPDPVVDWIDTQADGIESRASFIRRSLVALMKAEQRRLQLSSAAPRSPVEHYRSTGGVAEF